METTKDLSQIEQGLRKFVRLIPLRQDPIESKYIQDEFDVLEVLDQVEKTFLSTVDMFGKNMYKNSPYDFVDDVKKEIEEWLLNAREPRQASARRKMFQPMYYLIIAPLIELFSTDTHPTALREIKSVIARVKDLVENHEFGGNYDDALIARAVIQREIRLKEEARKTKKTRSRKATIEEADDSVEELAFE